MSDSSGQAYAGPGGIETGNDEANRQDFLVRQILGKVVTATLVEVTAVRDDKVCIKPLVAQIDAAGNAFPHGSINNVPVWRPQAGGVRIIMTPVTGDVGLAVFCHSDISSVVANDGKASNPGSRRKFDWSDAIYLGGLFGDEPTVSVTLDPDDGVVVKGVVGTDTEYRVDGQRVVTNRQGAITDPTGGGTIDAQARTAVIQILGALRAHGLIG